MTRCQILLTKLMEECGEVIERASKAMIFGCDELQPGQPDTNIRRTELELTDLLGVWRMLVDEGFVLDPMTPEETALRLDAKRDKVNRYYELSKARGMVDGVPADPTFVHPEARS